MNTIIKLLTSAIGLTALASACAVDGTMPEEDVAASEEAVCYNPQGVNAVMAALAVSAAQELRRWAPKRDLVLNYSRRRLEVSSEGNARCGGSCRNLKSLLALQEDSARGIIVGGQPLEPSILRERLFATMERQLVCNNRPDNHKGDDCPVEAHDLKFSSKVASSCGNDYWFHAYKAGSTTNLTYPWQLKNQLIWADYPDNPYLAFDVQGDDVKIDPTMNLLPGDTVTSGSCSVGCTKFSTASAIGQCCSCNGVTRSFQRSVFSPDMYLCK